MSIFTIPVEEVLDAADGFHFSRWFSQQFEGAIFVEAGTCEGRSAKRWAFNPTNLVITYDLYTHTVEGNHRSKGRLDLLDNVIYKELDVVEMAPNWFSKVDMIYVDISHDGEDEARFLELIEPYFKGILIMDDINNSTMCPELYTLFNTLEREHHLLPKRISSHHGTGIVPYGDWTVVVEDPEEESEIEIEWRKGKGRPKDAEQGKNRGRPKR